MRSNLIGCVFVHATLPCVYVWHFLLKWWSYTKCCTGNPFDFLAARMIYAPWRESHPITFFVHFFLLKRVYHFQHWKHTQIFCSWHSGVNVNHDLLAG